MRALVLTLLFTLYIPAANAVQCPIPNCPPDQLCFCPPPPPHYMVLENRAPEKIKTRLDPMQQRVRGNLRLTAMFHFQERFSPRAEPANKPEDQIPRWTLISFSGAEKETALSVVVRVFERSPAHTVRRTELWSHTLEFPAGLDAQTQARMLDSLSNDIMRVILKRRFSAFGTRMAYVDRRSPGQSVIRMQTVDAGTAESGVDAGKLLSFDKSLNRSPNWTPDRNHIVFTSHIRHNQDLYIVPADGSRQPHRVSAQPGMNHSATFSPDRLHAALTMDYKGSVDIFLLRTDFDSTRKWRVVRQLTNHHEIDTSPAFSPDGQKLAFVSARNGRAQIYTMNADGSGQKLMLTTPHRTFTPRWCKSGDREFLAFTQLIGRNSVIFVYNVTTQQGWQVTSTGAPDAENPSWSPHCNLIAYESHGDRNNEPGIYISPLVGGSSALLYRGHGRMPAWEPAAKDDLATPESGEN